MRADDPPAQDGARGPDAAMATAVPCRAVRLGHSSPLVTALAREPRCAFEVAGCEPPYRGVRGRAHVSVEPDAGLEILRRLVDRYLGDTKGRFASWLLERTTPEVVLRLDPVKVSSWDYTARMSRRPRDGVRPAS